MPRSLCASSPSWGLTRTVGGVLGLALARELTPVVTSIILAGALPCSLCSGGMAACLRLDWPLPGGLTRFKDVMCSPLPCLIVAVWGQAMEHSIGSSSAWHSSLLAGSGRVHAFSTRLRCHHSHGRVRQSQARQQLV